MFRYRSRCSKCLPTRIRGKASCRSLPCWRAHNWWTGCGAVFLAWFGGVGYLLARHSGLDFWIDLSLAIAVGLLGACLLAAFLRFLESREQPLVVADYDMVGVLGHVSSTIRPDGVGEV